MSEHGPSVVICLGVLVAGLALGLPETSSGILIVLWAFVCSVAILLAGKRTGGSAKLWRHLGLVGLAMGTGILIRGIHGSLVGVAQPIPSPADIIHVPTYIAFNLALLRVLRARAQRRDVAAWLDSLAISGALLIVLWVLGLGEFAFDSTQPIVTRSLNLLYNGLAISGFALLLRVSATPGKRPRSYFLLGAAAGFFVIADLAGTYALAGDGGVFVSIALSPLSFAFVVAASRHQSAGRLLEAHRETETVLGVGRVAVATMTVLAPLSFLFLRLDDYGPGMLLVSGSLAIGQAIIVVARLSLLVRNEQTLRSLERGTAREIARLARNIGHDKAAIRRELLSSIDRLSIPVRMQTFDDRDLAPNPRKTILVVDDGNEELFKLRYSSGHLLPAERAAIEALGREGSAIAGAIETQRITAELVSQADAARLLEISERRFRALVQHSSDIVIVLNPNGTVEYISDPVSQALDYHPDDFIGRSLDWAVHPNDLEAASALFSSVLSGSRMQEAHEFRAYHRDGSIRLFESIMTDMRDVAEVEGVVLNVSDVTARRRLERDLRDAETVDPLTLQLNRKAFIDEIGVAQRRASVTALRTVVAIVDLDDFKTINDALGPERADRALVETAQRIRRALRITDVVARLSGDEFGILFTSGYSDIEALAAVERVLAELRLPFAIDGTPIKLGATAGLASDERGGLTASQFLRNADTALTTAKQSRSGGALMFEEAMAAILFERLDLRNSLDAALANDELRLAYQPIVDAMSGEIVSMEALARWHHDTRGEVAPGVFIPIAEESEAILTLGEWALRTGCRQVQNWERQGYTGFTVSVNMSGHQLRQPDIIHRVAAILEETGVDPERMIIEITESVLIDETDFIAERIRRLRELGIALAIDDFGTGYSSLSYLQRYEFDLLKIDRAFVVPLADPERVKEREIVRSIISLARGLGAKTVAEGIEGFDEFEILQSLGCDRVQGYLFHHPIEVEHIPETLHQQSILSLRAA